MPDVHYINGHPEGAKMMRDLADKLERGEITDFVACGRLKDGNVTHHWFGENSCFYLLGMLAYMNMNIQDYIRAAQHEVEEVD